MMNLKIVEQECVWEWLCWRTWWNARERHGGRCVGHEQDVWSQGACIEAARHVVQRHMKGHLLEFKKNGTKHTHKKKKKKTEEFFLKKWQVHLINCWNVGWWMLRLNTPPPVPSMAEQTWFNRLLDSADLRKTKLCLMMDIKEDD